MDPNSRQPRKWTLEEDKKLRQEVEAQLIGGTVKDWCRIAAKLPGRTNKDCRKRWHNSVAGGLKKGQWSKSEDQLLSRGVEQFGQRWTLIANRVGSRSADQCAKRWQQSLDPELDRSEWRDEEDKILIEATQRLGRHWKDIQREHFSGRSKNCIKNRYTVLVRRYQNQGITLPSAASSPSEHHALTPMSCYPEDEGYLSPSPSVYDNLMPGQLQATPLERHRSWSSLDSDAYSTWSSPQDYNLPMAVTGPKVDHVITPLPHYAFTQPPTLGSNAPAVSTSWDWTTAPMTTSIHTGPAMANLALPNPPYYGYDEYPVLHESLLSQNASYAPSPAESPYSIMRNRSPTSILGSRATAEQQNYGANASGIQPDPRQPHHPGYHF